MKKSIGAAVFVPVLIIAGAAYAQGMLLDYAADRVIQKYTTSSCEQLKQLRDEPKSEKDKMAIEFLRNDSQARVAFIDKIAAPVANKMFECGLFP
jgi:replication initiation and membrane attachment protein DnaB